MRPRIDDFREGQRKIPGPRTYDFRAGSKKILRPRIDDFRGGVKEKFPRISAQRPCRAKVQMKVNYHGADVAPPTESGLQITKKGNAF